MSKTLDIPVKDLPFEAGEGFVATVENGIAHVVVTTIEMAKRTSHGMSWAERTQKAARKITKKDLQNLASMDERAASILEKQAPSILD